MTVHARKEIVIPKKSPFPRLAAGLLASVQCLNLTKDSKILTVVLEAVM